MPALGPVATAKAPPIVLLEEIKARLDLVPWTALMGFAKFTVRHYRHRPAATSEKPGVGIEFVADGASPDPRQNMMNDWEVVRALSVNLIFDSPLAPENANTDPTGWGRLMRLATLAFDALKILDANGTASGLSNVCDDVFRDEIGPNEDSKPDEGRLELQITVIYRVSATQPNRLLATGVTYDD